MYIKTLTMKTCTSLILLLALISCEKEDFETVSDFDGNIYQTIVLGDQIWMRENLKTTHYSDGTPIPLVTDSISWLEVEINEHAYCWFNNSTENKNLYGALYTWNTAMKGAESSNANPSYVQGVCPSGWHLPSDEEWKQLEMNLGMSQGDAEKTGSDRGTDEGSMLAGDVSLWRIEELVASESFGESGFRALPGGYRNATGPFYSLGSTAMFWSSTESISIYHNGMVRTVDSYQTPVSRSSAHQSAALYVRCVKN